MVAIAGLFATFSAVATVADDKAETSKPANASEAMTKSDGSKLATAAKTDEKLAALVKSLWPEAEKKGISREVFDGAFAGLRIDPEVLKRSENQPEHAYTIWQYMARLLTPTRLEKGRERLGRYGDLLRAIEDRFGVDRYVILAIWGVETTFGENKGARHVIRSLATLAAHSERWGRFGRTHLLAALQILQAGDVSRKDMLGSWAGAMGHPQFIPGTYLLHALDFDGDGKRDIWNNVGDALASAANLLKHGGWRKGEPWGLEVKLPDDFDYALSNPKTKKTFKEWAKLGVTSAQGEPLDDRLVVGEIFLPAGAAGPAFLITRNFRAILRYNNASAYAMSVGHLADRLRGMGPLVGAWPANERALTRTERLEYQRILVTLGYDTGGVDGILGRKTREAVRAYQRLNSLKIDGFPGFHLLERLRKEEAEKKAKAKPGTE